MKNILIPATLCAIVFSGTLLALPPFPLAIEPPPEGDNAVALTLPAALYPYSEGKLADELRVVDDKGSYVPYVERRKADRKESTRHAWHEAKIANVAETNGTLVVDVAIDDTFFEKYPDSVFTAVKIDTPRFDFDEQVEVFTGEKPIASGRIYDKSSFADVRSTEINASLGAEKTYRLVFAHSSESVAAATAQVVKTSTSSGESAVSEATQVERKPFRIRSVSFGTTIREVAFKAVEPVALPLDAELELNEKTDAATIVFNAWNIPARGIKINILNKNFTRNVKVSAWSENAWYQFKKGVVSAVNLGEKHSSELEIAFDGETRHAAYKVEIEGGDEGALVFDEFPVSLLSVPYEIVFIASGGGKYALELENGAKKPDYKTVLKEYLASGKETQSINLAETHEWQPKLYPTFSKGGITPFFIANIVTFAVIAVFVILLAVLIKLLTAPRQ